MAYLLNAAVDPDALAGPADDRRIVLVDDHALGADRVARCSRPRASSPNPRRITCAPVTAAMSSSIALRRSPKPGALTAQPLSAPRSWLTISVAGTSTVDILPGGVPGGRPPPAGDQPRRHRPCEEGRSGAHRVRAGRARAPVLARPAAEYPIGHKDHGVAFLMEQPPPLAALLAAAGRSSASATPSSRPSATTSTTAASRSSTRPIFTPAACEGTRTLFEVPYFDLGKAYLTQSGQLYGEAAAMALGQGLRLRARPSAPRRARPAATYRVLDGRAGGRLHGPRRRHGPRRGHARLRRRRRVLAKHGRSSRDPERDVEQARARPEALPAHHLHRGDRAHPAEARPETPIKWGDDIGGDEETILANQFDRPVMVHRYPAEMKAFYFKRDPPGPEGGARRRRAGARGLRRDHRRRPARGRLDVLESGHQGAGAAARGVRAGTSICAGTAPSRTPASAWAWSGPSPGSADCTTSARRFRSRG